MKKYILILFIVTFFARCEENENNQDVLTEIATIYFDSSGIDNCLYTLKTESNNFYAIENLSEEYQENDLKVKISYIKTAKKMNCGFSSNLTIIKLESIEKL